MKTASEYMRSRSTVNHINMELSGNSGESNADGLTRSITQRHITHRQLSHQGGNNHNKRSQHFLTRRHSSAALSGKFTLSLQLSEHLLFLFKHINAPLILRVKG